MQIQTTRREHAQTPPAACHYLHIHAAALYGKFFLAMFVPVAFLLMGPAGAAVEPSAATEQITAEEAAAETEELPSLPSLAVVVYSTGEGPSKVGMTFARQTKHSELKPRIEKMAQKAGWKLKSLQLKDEADPEDGKMLTLVTFECEEIVDWKKGRLGLKPLVEEFAAEKHFRIAFLVPGMENFSGPSGYSKDGLQIRLIPGDEVYEYEITPAQTQPPENGETTDSAPEKEPGGRWITVLLILIASFASLSVVIGWLWCGRKKKNSQE